MQARSARVWASPAIAALAITVWGGCDGDLDSVSQPIAGPAPDYVVSALSDPPAAALNGAGFSITTTVENRGSAAAVSSSTTRFFLSSDPIIGGDHLIVKSAVVPPLGIGATDTQTVTLAILAGVPSGSYHVLACADRTKTVPELSDRNNCAASAATVAVTGPDLLVEAVVDPPPALEVGAGFSITDTTRNSGTAAAASSWVGYFLSPIPARGPGARLLSRRRSTGPLGVGDASSGTFTTTVPAIPPGSYFLVACADLSGSVAESNEKNNCTASSGTAQIRPPSGIVIDSVLIDGTFIQVHQSSEFDIVINGSGLEGVTDITIYDGFLAPGSLVATPIQVRARMSVDFAPPGPRDVTVSSATGSATATAAIEVTPWVFSATAAPGGRATFESPMALRDYQDDARNGATLLFLAGEHRRDGQVYAEVGANIVGQGAATTSIRGETGTFDGFFVNEGTAALRDLTIIAPNGFASVYANRTTNLDIRDVVIVGDGIEVSPSLLGTSVTVDNLSYDAQGGGGTGLRAAVGVWQYGEFGAVVTISNSRFSACGTGLWLEAGRADITGTTIEGCDLGMQAGLPPNDTDDAPDMFVDVTASQLLDNTQGIRLTSGQLVVTDTEIADIEATPRPSLVGIGASSAGFLVVSGGAISGQDQWGIFGDSMELNDLVVTGGEIGIGLEAGGDPEWIYLQMRDCIVRDQTVASVQFSGTPFSNSLDLGNGGAAGGNQLSVLSGFALDDIREGFYGVDDIIATGITLNGNTYTGYVQGPASVPPDYRMVYFRAAIVF